MPTRIDRTILEVVGPYGDDGIQDADGVEHFNDLVATPWGMLGKLLVEFEDGVPIIVQADQVVLIRRGFPDEWTTPTVGASVVLNPFGFDLFDLDGRNGRVRYRLYSNPLAWSPDVNEADNPLAKWQIGTLDLADWTPERPQPPRTRNEVKTEVLRSAK